MAATLRLITEVDEGYLSDSRDHDLCLDPEQQLADAELRHQIETQLQTLDAEEREVVRRHYFEGERLEDIANHFDFSKSWASRLHSRALARLGKRLQAEPEKISQAIADLSNQLVDYHECLSRIRAGEYVIVAFEHSSCGAQQELVIVDQEQSRLLRIHQVEDCSADGGILGLFEDG